ncbi:MAG: hypothetical protein IH592_14820 [Bacteroidales bacterium]|nr:hypothetical protein [Bacteroidales bacterium]
MIKRTTAIIFLMLANILLLAHAVVPHHHHNKEICFERAHCINDDLTDDHGTNRHGHSHDGENCHDNCVLKEPVLVFSNQWHNDFKLIKNTSGLSGLDDYQYNILNSRTEFLVQASSAIVPEHPDKCSYSSIVSASLGLRAPPVV